MEQIKPVVIGYRQTGCEEVKCLNCFGKDNCSASKAVLNEAGLHMESLDDFNTFGTKSSFTPVYQKES
jgi:hypothetical protein